MTQLTVEIPDVLLAKLKGTGRSPQEVIVEALQRSLETTPVAEKRVSSAYEEVRNKSLEVDPVDDAQQIEETPLIGQTARRRRRRKPKYRDLPRKEIVKRLVELGFISPPEESDSSAAQEWRALSEEKCQQHIRTMDDMYFADSPASTYIIESRR